MGIIKHLSENTINKIAAGEVVERPLSVVKELIENSIDANSTNITVEIEKGGKKKIRVKDDGSGLTVEDLYMALERHATSKISSIEELTSIPTMGFRGEAIPSIASVTKFSIASAVEHGNGFKISMSDVKILSDGSCSLPKGTEVNADNIFFNVPARKKFLKSDEREFALVREMIQKFAIIHYTTTFSFFHNKKAVFQYPAVSDKLSRILHIWKAEEKDVRTLASTRNGVTVTVFIPSPFSSFPGISATSVNNRIVSDRFINSIIFKTLRETIGGEFKSPVILNIDTDLKEVDINVHPSKMEVRFHDTPLIFSLVRETVANALLSFREDSKEEKFPVYSQKDLKEKEDHHYDSVREKQPGYITRKNGLVHGKIEKHRELNIFDRDYETIEPSQESFYDLQMKDYRIVGTVFGVYIVIESKDKLIFLDQHASHERITFNRLVNNARDRSGLSQLLIVPVIIKMSPKELSIMEEIISSLSEAGFIIEKFDDESAILRAVPAIGFDADWETIIKELIGELENYGEGRAFEEKILSLLAVTACRASVKCNDTLSDKEIKQLIEDINNSKTLTCPHGRPFFFVMNRHYIEKQVNRK